MRIHIITLVILLAASSVLSAQTYSSSNKKAVRQYEQGVTALHQGQRDRALDYFRAALKSDPDFNEIGRAHV